MNKALEAIWALGELGVQDIFPRNPSSRYFNTAGSSQLPQPMSMALQSLRDTFDDHGALGRRGQWLATEILEAARTALQNHLGAPDGTVALTSGATEALVAVTSALKIEDGTHIAIGLDEHPSLEIPFESLRRRGAHISHVATHLPPQDQPIAENISICALSLTSYRTGRNLHPDWPAFLRARGIMFIADGTQTVGLCPINVASLGCDALAATGHKWLHGPLGAGCLYVAERALPRLPHRTGGWRSIRTQKDGLDLWHNARGFEGGTLDFASFAGLAVSATWMARRAFWNDLVDARADRANIIVSHVSELSELDIVHDNSGFICVSPREGLVFDAHDIAEKVWSRGGFDLKPFSKTECPVGAIRISTSPFNSLKDCDCLGKVLKSVMAETGSLRAL